MLGRKDSNGIYMLTGEFQSLLWWIMLGRLVGAEAGG